MGVRLNIVLTELNIGLQMAVDFLKHENIGEIKDDVTINTKIHDLGKDNECIVLAVAEF